MKSSGFFSASKFVILPGKEAFHLISRYDGRALRFKADGFAEMATVDEKDGRQLWVTSDYGNQLINVETNLPLQVKKSKHTV